MMDILRSRRGGNAMMDILRSRRFRQAIPGWPFGHRETFKMWVAWHLPRWLVYWATIRLTTWNVAGNPAERPVIDALKAWPWK